MQVQPPTDRHALFYLTKTGCQWRYLSPCFPPWTLVYYYFRQWRDSGQLTLTHDALRALTRRKAGREEHPSVAIIDSQSVKTSFQGGVRGFDGGKTIIFGVFKREGRVYTETVPNASKKMLQGIIRGRVKLESMIHSDG